MTTWNEYIEEYGTAPEWPYPLRYEQESVIASDVLIIGGGVAGCHAAITAARQGATVTLVETGNPKRSGQGGAGVDHWLEVCTNPCSKVTPLDYTLAWDEVMHGYTNSLARYIVCKESWDTLLECEEMGIQIRDVHDEFKGAPFRDDETKLMFAYDYENRHEIRVWGFNLKPLLYAAMKRLRVQICDRTVVTSLLTEQGRQGTKVVGATGVNMRTGEFYAFKSKATIIAGGGARRLFSFAPEVTAATSMGTMNSSGGAHAIGWQAGAEFVLMEQTMQDVTPDFGYAPYSMGNAHNSWHGVSIVDADGKEVPWVGNDGKLLENVDQRFLPKTFALGHDRTATLIHDLPERIRKGELKLPLYADLTRLSPLERRCIFGMMMGNEGKTRIPIYGALTQGGFDPDKDLLQAPVLSPEGYSFPCFWLQSGTSVNIRTACNGGYLVDWNLQTSLEGLYAAGSPPNYGSGFHSTSQTMGRYAARHAVAYAKTTGEPVLDARQVAEEKERVYRPIKASRGGIGWKELNFAIARVMQDYCGKYKNELTLTRGLDLLKQLRENEGTGAHAANPHELGRTMECFSLITMGEMIMHASLARKSSNAYLDFYRLDYPEMNPPEWEKLLPMRLENDTAKTRELPLDFYLKAPYAPDFEENYQRHSQVGK